MKKFVFILVGVLILAGIPLTVFLGMRSQELRKRAAPATNISLTPASVTKNVQDEFTLEARIDTADNQVVAAQISLVFDPTKLEATSITNGTLFPNILSSGVVGNGTASIAVGAANTTTPVQGTGTAAVIKFKALESTTSPITIRFSPDTYVGALGEGSTNVLVGTTPTTVTISGGTANKGGNLNATATPTPTIPAGTVTPTVTPILTPTLSASDSASPSAVSITTPLPDESITTDLPTIQGKAPPGSTVTIVIHSAEEITATVTTDANGNWSYTLDEPLSDGPHTIVAAASDPSNNHASSATLAFVVATGTDSDTAQGADAVTAENPTPVSGAYETTIIFLGLGLLLILIGSAIPALSK